MKHRNHLHLPPSGFTRRNYQPLVAAGALCQLTPLGVGNRGCEENGPEINQQGDYLDALYKSAVYQVSEAGQLEVLAANGEILLVFLMNGE